MKESVRTMSGLGVRHNLTRAASWGIQHVTSDGCQRKRKVLMQVHRICSAHHRAERGISHGFTATVPPLSHNPPASPQLGDPAGMSSGTYFPDLAP